MNTRTVIPILGALAILLLPGCTSTPVMVRPAQTNVVEVVRTNYVQVIQTNTVVEVRDSIPVTNTVVVTNALLSMTTNVLTLVSPPVFYTNLSLSPIVETAVKVGGDLAPVPWGGAAGGVVVGLIGAAMAVVNEKRRRTALGQAMSWETTAGVLVENVETVRKAALAIPGYTPQIDKSVVRSLEVAQRLAGVKDRIAGMVEERTDYTHTPEL